MCLQCDADAVLVKSDVLPGLSLYISNNDTQKWPIEQYGLVACNDPIVIIPRIVGSGDEDNYDQWEKYHAAVVAMEENLNALDFAVSSSLAQYCLAGGWEPGKDGKCSYWLMSHLAKHI